MTSLRVSVVLATYNRAETLQRTLEHLAGQDLDPAAFEVLVVDDGSPDRTPDVVRDFAEHARFRLRSLRHDNRGPGYTQNRGLRAAEAPVVLLIADDIFLTPGALSAHLAAHDAHPEQNTAVLGGVVQSPDLGGSVFLQNWEPFRFADFEGLAEVPYYRFWACNISAKRDFVLRYGPFREGMGRAGAASHEDPELGYRLHKGGLRILFSPAALGHHYHITTFEGACARRYMQGLNFGDFCAHVPEPEIPVAYHALTIRTVGDHLRAWFGPRRRHLSKADRNPAFLLARAAAHRLAFNRWTVPFFWTPLLVEAERRPMFAKLAKPAIYRGVTFHHFLRGCRDGERLDDGVPSASPA